MVWLWNCGILEWEQFSNLFTERTRKSASCKKETENNKEEENNGVFFDEDEDDHDHDHDKDDDDDEDNEK